MGMYTQVRGVLCAGSINSNFEELETKFIKLQNDFLKRDDLARTWVCQNSHILQGSNGSAWIFIGAEFKNYCGSMDRWIEYICENIKCEGRIEYQYEEYGVGDSDNVWIIKDSKIKIKKYKIHTIGYGFNI